MLLARRNNDANLMSNFFDDFFDTNWMPKMNSTAPAVNVKEDVEKFTMEIAVPGLKKEYCRVNVTNQGCLEVKLENKMEHKDEDKKEHYLRREFYYTNFEQTYALPENVDPEKITAKVDNGILRIEMPKFSKKEEDKQRRLIEIA
ncbi:MAG: Hsp20/alpha crystallin family protein [Bacteroidaceae bacterium]|nr:Hsp20/alpha crystallin family protein [Bacteroidaceae bacterium]MBR3633558.1 Hsp20/alpha crystallin family protein [Bacteroidaceae bacterium]MBR3732945.1 Hsp20/alpha crystallin family protein [Bacteroidaceae bacterium]